MGEKNKEKCISNNLGIMLHVISLSKMDFTKKILFELPNLDTIGDTVSSELRMVLGDNFKSTQGSKLTVVSRILQL